MPASLLLTCERRHCICHQAPHPGGGGAETIPREGGSISSKIVGVFGIRIAHPARCLFLFLLQVQSLHVATHMFTL